MTGGAVPDGAAAVPSAETVRGAVRSWLELNWRPDRALRDWRSILVDSGWACPTWPRELYGRDLPAELGGIVLEEIRRAGAVGPAVGVGIGLVAPTLLEHGSAEIKLRLLRPIATGEDAWCQLFSEPGSGSDLAGLTTSAVRDGDEWVINGQKLWTTGAAHAGYGLLLARTDPSVPRHEGITAFALPLRQPGIEVRPLRQMNGYASFNEVFITDARVPQANVIGVVGAGWGVARTTLAHERHLAANLLALMPGEAQGRTAQEAMAEALAYFKTYEWYPQRQGRADLAPVLAREAGRSVEPLVRQQLAQLYSLERLMHWMSQRASASAARGAKRGPEGSLSKLAASRLARAAARTHSHIAGAWGLLAGDDAPHAGVVTEVLLSVPAQSIAGGTDEIQRSIVAEKVLGLPREPQPADDSSATGG
ncbi:MAG: putative acyl-CoA dehydrogenase FadE17 [Acidimicrobiales bacterium]|nr:putative acyl-CoA dehydrogenase FadE17 [Acidimicrobiales bacterium]